MNRIDQTFNKLRETGHKAFITYTTGGDPDMETSIKVVKKLVDAGADIIELGVPFSDPLADGPTIQKAITRALSSNTTTVKMFNMVKELRKTADAPIVFMTYYNIVYKYGSERFVKEAVSAGVDGIIIPDLPMEESDDLIKICRQYDFHLILLAAPTTPLQRFKKISSLSGGFVYYVSLTGVTGARKDVKRELYKDIMKLKKHSNVPVCVGFGVSNAKQAKKIASYADGVIVGSAIINRIEENLGNNKKMVQVVGSFAKSIAKAIHGVKLKS